MPTGLGDEQLWISATNDNTGTSTAFNDQSGQGNNGTATGALVVADTSEGGTYAFEFDGVDDYIQSSGPDNWTQQSVSFWMQTTGSAEDFPRLVEKGFNNEWTVALNKNVLGGKSKVTVQVGSGSYNAISTTDIDDGAWHNVTAVIDAAHNVDLYVDGVLEDSGSGTSNSKTGDVFIGGTPSFTSANFDGLIDDVRIYDRALTQAEITHLASQRGIEGPPPVGLGDEKLWLCPSLNDSAADISGNGNDGTYQGGMGTIADTSNGGIRCYDFDGSNDYIDCGPVFRPTGNFSISFWVLNDTTTKNVMYVSKNWDGTSEGYISRYDGAAGVGDLKFYTYSSGTIYGTDAADPFTTSQWACVANVYNGTHWEIYIDGVLASQTAQTQPPYNSPSDLWIGATSVAGWNFDGRMDDIRAYDRALTQAEITHLATSRGIEGSPSTTTTQYDPFITHAFKQLFQARLR